MYIYRYIYIYICIYRERETYIQDIYIYTDFHLIGFFSQISTMEMLRT